MNRIKGRMFVVNDDTFSDTLRSGVASIKYPVLPFKSEWLFTVSSIIADMLQIEIGDYLFFWKTKNGHISSSKSEIYGVYRATSKPYYECLNQNDDAPFKIHFEKAYDFINPITEYELLNCPYINSEPWNIIGKKVSAKGAKRIGRGTSPLSIEEINNLIILLINRNPNYTYYEFNNRNIVNVINPLQISYRNKGDNSMPHSLSSFHPNNLNYIKTTFDVQREKVLEGIFNQEMANYNVSFFAQLDIDVNKVLWYCNYLPYSIDGMEFDYVIIESDDGFAYSKIKLIEFEKDVIDEDHINRAIIYSKWLNERLALGGKIVEPIIICEKCDNFASTTKQKFLDLDEYCNQLEHNNNIKQLKVYTYDLSGENMIFARKR